VAQKNWRCSCRNALLMATWQPDNHNRVTTTTGVRSRKLSFLNFPNYQKFHNDRLLDLTPMLIVTPMLIADMGSVLQLAGRQRHQPAVRFGW